MRLKIRKWIKGMKITQFLGELFKQKNAAGEITVQASAQKVISVIDQTFALWSQYESTFRLLFSNEAEASADRVKALMGEIKGKLSAIVILPDIAEGLQEYKFAENPEWNEFYHSLITTAALAFNDKEISLYEAWDFVSEIALFIKEHK